MGDYAKAWERVKEARKALEDAETASAPRRGDVEKLRGKLRDAVDAFGRTEPADADDERAQREFEEV